jgi:IclR family acetate operon transcriptional repressor
LSHVWSASLDISAVAQPMMRRLWEKTGETVALFVSQGGYRVCMAEIPSIQPLSFKRGVGYREKVMVGASGRAILASMSDASRHLAGEQVDAGFEKELARIRERGYAVSKDELIQGAVAVAAPFFHGGDQVAGSLAVFGPSVRLRSAEINDFGTLLVQEAQQLSRVLGKT